MRPVAEQTILITGATDGLGKELAAELAASGARLLIHGRDDARGQETIDAIRATTGNDDLRWVRADFASLDEVRGLAAQLLRDHDRLDVLVNNAGVGAGESQRQLSRDGYELRFAVNYLAGYLVTCELLPLLQRSAPARIVNVSSIGQAPIDFDDVMLERGYDGFRAYAQSKLAQIMFTFDLAEELDPDTVTANSLHPATFMPTKMVLEGGATPISSLEEGVEATVRLVADPQLDGVSGRFFDRLRPAEPNPQARDAGARRRLRELSDRLCGLDRT